MRCPTNIAAAVAPLDSERACRAVGSDIAYHNVVMAPDLRAMS